MTTRVPLLRDATRADADLCFRIKKQAFGEYVDEVWGWDEGLQRRLHDRDYDEAVVKVVQVDGKDIGYLVVTDDGTSVWVGQIYILPLFQNRGFGTRLVRDVIRGADAVGKSVKLQVLKINPARNLYERLGFVVTGTNGPHHVMERPVTRSAVVNRPTP